MSEMLFAGLAKDFSVARVTAKDARLQTDLWQDLRRLIVACDPMYPRIDKWVDDRVRAGVESRRRSAFIGYHNGVPVVSSVVKFGRQAKFCHLKVEEQFRSSNIGEFFFALMTLEVAKRTRRVHFTLPENLWEEKKLFFSSFAFNQAEKCEKQYRLFENELHCAAPFESVWKCVRQKLPKLAASLTIDNCSHNSDLLMSLRPRYANSILQGKKSVEVRRSFSPKWLGSRIALYATAPVSSVVGEAVIERLVEDAPAKVWSEFARRLGCTKGEFDNYASDADTVFALVLTEVRRYARPLALNVARTLTGERLLPPQNYSRLMLDSPWSRALPIAGLLQQARGCNYI